VPKISTNVFVLIIANYRDMGEHRAVSEVEIASFAKKCGEHVRYLEASMKNCFGLKGVKSFLDLPFLKLQRSTIEFQLKLNTEEMERVEQELRVITEAQDYNSYLEWIQRQKENKILATRAAQQQAHPPSSPKSPEIPSKHPTQPVVSNAGKTPPAPRKPSTPSHDNPQALEPIAEKERELPQQNTMPKTEPKQQIPPPKAEPKQQITPPKAEPKQQIIPPKAEPKQQTTPGLKLAHEPESTKTETVTIAGPRGTVRVTRSELSNDGERQAQPKAQPKPEPAPKTEPKKTGFFSKLFSRGVDKEEERKQQAQLQAEKAKNEDVVAKLHAMKNQGTQDGTPSIDHFAPGGSIDDWFGEDEGEAVQKDEAAYSDDDDKANPMVAADEDSLSSDEESDKQPKANEEEVKPAKYEQSSPRKPPSETPIARPKAAQTQPQPNKSTSPKQTPAPKSKEKTEKVTQVDTEDYDNNLPKNPLVKEDNLDDWLDDDNNDNNKTNTTKQPLEPKQSNVTSPAIPMLPEITNNNYEQPKPSPTTNMPQSPKSESGLKLEHGLKLDHNQAKQVNLPNPTPTPNPSIIPEGLGSTDPYEGFESPSLSGDDDKKRKRHPKKHRHHKERTGTRPKKAEGTSDGAGQPVSDYESF